MKLLKRITALALSAAMVLSMSVSALATEGNTPAEGTEPPAESSCLEGCTEDAHIEGCPLFEESKDEVVCANLEGCSDESHNADCPLYEEPKVEPIVCKGEADIDCLAETHIEGCNLFVGEEPVVECDGTLDCKATENHLENCQFVLSQQPVVTDGEDSESVEMNYFWSNGGGKPYKENEPVLIVGNKHSFYLCTSTDINTRGTVVNDFTGLTFLLNDDEISPNNNAEGNPNIIVSPTETGELNLVAKKDNEVIASITCTVEAPTTNGYSLHYTIGNNNWKYSTESVTANNVAAGTSVEIGLSYNSNQEIELVDTDGKPLFTITYLDGTEIKHLSNVTLVGNGGNKYAKFTIPTSLIGKTLTFAPTIDGAQNLTVTINVEEPAYTLKMKDTNGNWTSVGDKIQMEVGKPVTLGLWDKNDNKINLVTGNDSEKNFRAHGDGAQIKFLGDGTVQLFVVADGKVRLEYGLKNDKKYEWPDIVELTDENNVFQWYVNGEPSGMTHTVTSSDPVPVTLKKGNNTIVLNNNNCRVQSGNYNISFANDGFNLSAKSGNVNVRYYYATNANGTPDTSVYLEFVLKNTNAGPYFVHQTTTESLDEYTFTALATQNPELGTLTVYLNGGSTGTVDPNELDMRNFSVYDENSNDITNTQKIIKLERESEDSNQVIIKAISNGTVILKYADDGYDEDRDGVNETRYAQMKITIDLADESYALYDDNGKPLVLERGTAYGDTIPAEHIIVVKKLVNGAAKETVEIESITSDTCVDQNGFASPDEAAQSLYVAKNNEGKWAVYTANYKAGEYHLPITVELTDGFEVSFTLKYTVATGDSSEMHFYVGTDKPFHTIQEALNAAMANDSASMRYIHIDEGTYTADSSNNLIDGTETDENKRDGVLELHLDNDDGYTNFSITGEGKVTIKGYLVYDPLEGRLPVVLNNITFEHPDYTANSTPNDNKPAIKVIHDSHNDRDALTLQNVTIRGYGIGMSGNPFALNTRNVVIQNCNIGLQLGVTNNNADDAPQQIVYRDGSNYVLNSFTFRNNNTAIQIQPAAEGKLKLRDNLFIDNGKNIDKADDTIGNPVYYNAAFNTYNHTGLDYNVAEVGIDSKFNGTFGNGGADADFYSPFYKTSATARTTDSKPQVYISPEQMKGLLIDAKEANTDIDTSNFAGKEVSVSIATVSDNGTDTTASEYATWTFNANETLASQTFNPLIEYTLEETVPSDVTAYQPVHFEHHNALPGKATVTINKDSVVGSLDTSKPLYLYKVIDGQLEKMDDAVTYYGTAFTFTRDTCSDYIITDTEIKDEVTPPSEGGEENEEQGGNQGGSDDNVQNGSSSTPSYDSSEENSSSSNTNDFISAGEVEDKLDSSKSDKVTMSVVTRDKVAQKAFEELAETDKTLVLKGNGYSWTINGADLNGKLSAAYFKTGVSEDSPYKAKVKKLAAESDYQIIYTEHHGKLPGKFTLTLKVNKELQNDLLYLYYFNPQTGKAEPITSGLKADSKGNVTIVFNDHLSTYFLTNKALTSVSEIDSGKENPSTGAASFAEAAAALALCSLTCGAVLSKKKA